MDGLLPVNISAQGLRAVAAAKHQKAVDDPETTDAQTPPAPPATVPDPPTVDELAIWDQENYQLSANAALTLGFPLWGANAAVQTKVIVFGVSRYMDKTDGNQTYRFGVAIRVLLEILDSRGDAKLSLPGIAAQVELGLLQASSRLIISGYKGNIGQQMPAWQSFDVKSYGDYFVAISNLQKTIFTDSANLVPVLLSTTLATDVVGEQEATSQHSFWHSLFHSNG